MSEHDPDCCPVEQCPLCEPIFNAREARPEGFLALRDLLATMHPGAVGGVRSITTKPSPELVFMDARAALLDKAAAVAELLGSDDAARINADLAEHSRLGETAATATLADALAELYAANNDWQRAQVRRFAPSEIDPEDE